MYHELQACARHQVTCVDDWIDRRAAGPVYVFIPKGRLSGPASHGDCCPALRETMAASDKWVVIYDGPGASIFAPVDAVAGVSSAPTSK